MNDVGPWYLKRVRIRRLRLGLRIYRHQHPGTPDRWVIQPEVIYDRKRR